MMSPKRGAAKRKADTVAESAESKKSKTSAKGNKARDEMPLADRTAISGLKRAMYIGAHVSSAGGVQNSVTNATHIGANSFALFLKSQRKWTSPPLAPEARDGFRANLKSHDYSTDHILPHGSYLVNLAQADAAKADQAYENFVDDLKRCERLGIKLYNFHPGSTGGAPKAEAIARIAKQLNKSHKATKSVITVIENMAGSGNVIGGPWEDLRDIIALVEDKNRVGVCIDTCHAFAAGHDLRTPETFEASMKAFDKAVGNTYLKALHLNDSKAPFACNRDVHANIGYGFLGLRAFHSVMNYPPFENLPMVLETPIERPGKNGKLEEDKQVWADEIKLLESLIGMDAESDEFAQLEQELAAKGTAEREKFQAQADKKAKGAKGNKAKTKKAPVKKGKKKKFEKSEDEESD